ncbi:MAG TPA: hypothetical protein VFZ58_00470 [Candidatus Saccharimonadales bacterium]
MRVIAGCLRVLVIVLSLLAMAMVSPRPVAAQQHKCVAELGLVKNEVELATSKTPIVSVHGYKSNPEVWQGKGSIEELIKSQVRDGAFFYFNYEHVNTRWVTDPDIAPRLTKYIACYSILSKRPVILLTHSMGGLAAREAFDSAAYGIHIKDVVEHVITIAPPHKGSRYADVESYFWLSACEAPFGALLVDACKQINTARATGGMQIGSEQLAKLAHFPPGVSVKTIAGEVSWQACLPWGCSPAATTGGDLAVSVESATAEYTNHGRSDGKKVFTCTSDTLISPWSSAWCEHNNLLRAPQVQAEVVNSIKQYLKSGETPATNLFGLGLKLGNKWQIANEYGTKGRARVVDVSRCKTPEDRLDCPQFIVVDLAQAGAEWLPYTTLDDPVYEGCLVSTAYEAVFYAPEVKEDTFSVGGLDAQYLTLQPCTALEKNLTMHVWRIPTKNILIYEHGNQTNKPLAGLEELLKNAEWL